MPLDHAIPSQHVADTIRARLESFAGTPDGELHALAGLVPADLSLEAPHEVYTLGLDQLASVRSLDVIQAGGWRYLLQRGDNAVASAQTVTDAVGTHVFAEFNSGPFVASTAEALSQARQMIGDTGTDASVEPRLLHVPALHAMALWLHSADSGTDVVIPLKPVPPTVDPDRQYSVEQYLAALREAATSVSPIGLDDTTGG